MKFNAGQANRTYNQMFGEPLDCEVIETARNMTDKEFDDNQGGVDDDGEYIESEFSAGQWDCIDGARH